MEFKSIISNEIRILFEKNFGKILKIEKLPGAGSDRKYFRIWNHERKSVIATLGADKIENKSFIELSTVFKANDIPVPEIYAVSDDFSVYLQQDLGDKNLLSLLNSEEKNELIQKTFSNLIKIQTLKKEKWIDNIFNNPFSKRQVMWDLNYFKYDFLKPANISFNEENLENDFDKLSFKLSEIDKNQWGFMYRDFQSRNIIIHESDPYFIDFQGGRYGPLLYDAVSFLWQAKADFSSEERIYFLKRYIYELSQRKKIDEKNIFLNLPGLIVFRLLQVIGAYGFRGLIEKKAHFIESLPLAIQNLKEVLEKNYLKNYPELEKTLWKTVESRYHEIIKEDNLCIKIFSFSFKKGYPEDLTGNGGGFMFDCRGLHNPGRYEEFKSKTGLDNEVVLFLNRRKEVTDFLDTSLELVKPSIETYLKRKFTSLQIGFGCTGGQHRSVYCARKMAKRLKEVFPDVKIIVYHRELDINEIYE